jgi:hypothetical protein
MSHDCIIDVGLIAPLGGVLDAFLGNAPFPFKYLDLPLFLEPVTDGD